MKLSDIFLRIVCVVTAIFIIKYGSAWVQNKMIDGYGEEANEKYYKKLSDSSYSYKTDSLCRVIEADKEAVTYMALYLPTDTALYINAAFSLKILGNQEIDSIFSAMFLKHRLQFATNITKVMVIDHVPLEEFFNKSINHDILWMALKFNGKYYRATNDKKFIFLY